MSKLTALLKQEDRHDENAVEVHIDDADWEVFVDGADTVFYKVKDGEECRVVPLAKAEYVFVAITLNHESDDEHSHAVSRKGSAMSANSKSQDSAQLALAN